MKRYPKWHAVGLVALALAGCGGGGGAPSAVVNTPPVAVVPAPTPALTPAPTPASTPAPSSVEREILPALTSATITTNLSPHITINPDAAVVARNRLFVMLPGTGGTPRNQRLILRTAASRGYYAIGLTYPNDEAITQLCATNAVDDCTGLARREVITGEAVSPLVNVTTPNSIRARLTALLTHLHATFPTEGWGQFLATGQPDWSRITVASHSQGAGHAGYMAKLFLLDRTVMFSAPGDTGAAPGTLAPWLSLPNVTPVSRQYGFIHTADELAPASLVIAGWGPIGLGAFGAAVSVDTVGPDYGGSHQLTTSASPNPASLRDAPAHGATVVDVSTPLTATGEPLYRPVWIYLAFP